jgi:hypothetical protein
MDMETLTVTYESPENLLREVQSFGGLRRPGRSGCVAGGGIGPCWPRSIVNATPMA